MKKNFIFVSILILLLIFPIISATSVLVDLNTSRISYGHELLWRANVTGNYDEQGIAIYANDTMFVNSQRDNKIYAVNATNGSIIWEFDVGTPSAISGFGGPHYYDGVIYDAFNYNVWAINATSGVKIWNYSQGTTLFAQNVAVDERYVVAVSYPSHLVVVLNKSTGEKVWNVSVGTVASRIAAEPLLFEDYLVIAAYSTTGKDLVAYNVTNGTEFWARDDGEFWDSAPILYNNQIFIASESILSSRYLINGSTIWDLTNYGDQICTPSVHDDVVFNARISLASINFSAVYINGTIKWTFSDFGGKGTEEVYNQPSISNGIVFFNTICQNCDNAVDGDGYIYAINETNGNLIWKYHINEDVFGYTSIAQGNIYTVTDDGYLYAFDFGLGSGDYTLIGHDSNRTGYTADGITSWESVIVNCTENSVGNYTCDVKNNYTHDISNVLINFHNTGHNYDVYNVGGSLLQANSQNYTISSISSLATETIVIVQNSNLTNCLTISSPGQYTLLNDISNVQQHCFIIKSNNVTLNCQDHLIDGEDAYGLTGLNISNSSSTPLNNVTIKNCKFNDFMYSVWMTLLENSSFYNITSTSASQAGIYLRINVNYNLFEDIIVNSSSSHGVHSYFNSVYNNFSNCTIHANLGNGLYLQSSPDYYRVYNSSIYGNNVNINIDSASIGNRFYNNNITNATTSGVHLNAVSTDNNYFYNNFFNNTLNVKFQVTTADNYFNTTFDSGINNIRNNLAYGGNYWAKPNGLGYSETCTDANNNGICDLAYDVESNASCIAGTNCTTASIDYLPLKDMSANTAPSIIANSTSPSTIYTDTDLLVNLTITDPNSGDTLTGYVRVYVNGTSTTPTQYAVVSNNTSTLIANFSSANYSRGDNLTIEIWAGDGTVNATAVNLTNITVANYALVVDLSSLDLMVLEEDSSNLTINLSNYVSDTEDADSLINWSCSDNETNFTVQENNVTKLINLTSLNNFHSVVNVTCTAYDSVSATAAGSFLVNVTSVADVSIITLISPTTNKGDPDGNVTFSYNVSASGVSVENCSLILNEILNTTNTSITTNTTQNFTLNNTAVGHYNWSVNCTNADSEVYSSSTNHLTIFKFQNFTTNSTSLNDTNVSNITNFVIDYFPYGKINFSTNVNIEDGADLDEHINISFNNIYLNSTNLTFLNVSARVTLYNLTFTNPRPLVDGVFCSDCTEVSYSDNNFIFDVTHFSNYSAEESPASSEVSDTSTSSGGGLPFQNLKINLTTKEIKQRVYLYDKLQLSYQNKTYATKVLKINDELINLSINSEVFSIFVKQDYYFKLNNTNNKLKISYVDYSNNFKGDLIFSIIEWSSYSDSEKSSQFVTNDSSINPQEEEINNSSPGKFTSFLIKIFDKLKSYYEFCRKSSSILNVF